MRDRFHIAVAQIYCLFRDRFGFEKLIYTSEFIWVCEPSIIEVREGEATKKVADSTIYHACMIGCTDV